MRKIAFALLALTLAGCELVVDFDRSRIPSGGGDMGTRDMGARDMATPPDDDMGPPEEDMGPEEDAGPRDMGPRDMGPPPVDMGPPPADMGPPPADMGPPPVDMGPRDMGPPPPMDMGPPPPVDMGPPDLGPPDLGPPDLGPPDLGPPEMDMGPEDMGVEDTGPADDMGTDAGLVSFSTVYSTIIATGCSCHVAGSHQSGLNMPDADTAYMNLVNVLAGAGESGPTGSVCDTGGRLRVAPGDHAASLLWLKVDGSAGCGGRMPLGGASLSAADIALIAEWIDTGANP